jgi:hypothetical protein
LRFASRKTGGFHEFRTRRDDLEPRPRPLGIAIVGIVALLVAGACQKKESPVAATAPAPSPVPGTAPPSNPLRDAYFGDLHLHTSYSFDAFTLQTNTTPEDSYRYAMGEEVDYLGTKQKRHTPLDFLAVTDHAEYLGVVRLVRDPSGPLAKTEWSTLLTSKDPKVSGEAFARLIASLKPGAGIPEFKNPQLVAENWKKTTEAADRYYEPGRFTTFSGFEWTSAPGDGNNLPQNLHRCVIFKGSKVPGQPYSTLDSQNPEDLWTYLENARKTGSDVLAIPHNGNASNGLMFDTKTLSGKPLTKEYAERRMANEPATEIIQGKGQSDTNPKLSPTDEFAAFELWETLVGVPAPAHFMTGSYIRQSMGVGQQLQEKIGVNPFKYGIVAGTDYHSGISSTEEDNYPGSHGNQDNDPRVVLTATESISGEPPVTIGAGGLTGVWAESNTREGVFDAIRRKETFGTSGNLSRVRFFGGWGYAQDLPKQADWVAAAYRGGVPMGSDLPARAAGAKAPRFVVWAVKDPNAANLDRIQIIKVSTKSGRSREQIYDVAWSGDRRPDPRTGKVPPVGNTVDMETATYSNSIGAAELSSVWEDPDFDPAALATYYVRALEIPTPRWSFIWAVRNHLPRNTKMPLVIQERTWSSPIWYSPAN